MLISGWTTCNFEFGVSWEPRTPTAFTEHSLSVAISNIGNVSYPPSIEALVQAGRAIRINLRSVF